MAAPQQLTDRWIIQPGPSATGKSPTLREAAEMLRKSLKALGVHGEEQQIFFMRNAFANEGLKNDAPLSDGKAWFYSIMSLGIECNHPDQFRYAMPLEMRKQYPQSQEKYPDTPFRQWECVACESTAIDRST